MSAPPTELNRTQATSVHRKDFAWTLIPTAPHTELEDSALSLAHSPSTRMTNLYSDAHKRSRAAIERLSERLATIDFTLADVIKTTYFVTDVTLREEANRHYERTYAQPRPARSFVGVSELPYGATAEIEAIAYRAPYDY